MGRYYKPCGVVFHTATTVGGTGLSRYHGHGTGDEEPAKTIRRASTFVYFRIADGITPPPPLPLHPHPPPLTVALPTHSLGGKIFPKSYVTTAAHAVEEVEGKHRPPPQAEVRARQ